MQNLYNVNVASLEVLPTPEEIKQRLPLSESAASTVFQARETVQRILDRQDPRLFAVVGPCSIHDVAAARDYAQRLKALADEVQDTLFVIMRVYFEKPRTTVGWKGLINDPRMDDTFQIDEGLQIARRLLLDLAEIGLPAGTEALDPIVPQYISDLIVWTAIGARTTESQTHREIASGLSMPVGFKNGTNGSLEVAINALQSAARPHSFLGINPQGQSAVIRTLGNRYGHVVLRGGDRPNYDSVSIALCEKALRDKKLPVNLVVDCSHANSFKDPAMQPLVMRDCTHQIMEGNRSIVGLMIESNIGWGSQPLPADHSQLKYGVSITDACVDWETTEKMLRETHAKLKAVLPERNAA
ncbi:MAG: 3-deoxy-7-phosphoheptulonate synthase [Candidatus Competibacteraceae bacterium]